MPTNNAAVKTFQELEKLNIRTAGDYFEEFFKFSAAATADLMSIDRAVESVVAHLLENNKAGKKVMAIGNGGSAAIAIHALVDYAHAGGLKTADFNSPAMLTCMANDYGYENVFAKPIKLFAEKEDTLLAISSSGKSPNIIKACEAALGNGCYIVTFSGFGADNPLRRAGHINFYVPSMHYGFVELAHQMLVHCILDLFIKAKITVRQGRF
jgi:D-sedoheptulose 7-phosphate isomerase